MTLPTQYFDPTLAMWPDLLTGRKPLAPVRIGVDRKTGKVLIGWDHVRQSIEVIFATPFHTRVLRRWVGSFVPHILGEFGGRAHHHAVLLGDRIGDRPVGAVLPDPARAVPGLCDRRRLVAGADERRRAAAARAMRSSAMRASTCRAGHLGDFTPESQRMIGLVGRGSNLWETVPVVRHEQPTPCNRAALPCWAGELAADGR